MTALESRVKMVGTVQTLLRISRVTVLLGTAEDIVKLVSLQHDKQSLRLTSVLATINTWIVEYRRLRVASYLRISSCFIHQYRNRH